MISNTKENIIHDILTYRHLLGQNLSHHILFIHCFSGSDTTSSFYGISKGAAFINLIKAKKFADIAETFLTPNKSCDEIEKVGEEAALILYKSTDLNINSTRQRLLSEKVLKAKSFVKPEALPPTKSALRYHSLRCYLQLMEWLSVDMPNAEEWGWININEKYFPIILQLLNPFKKLFIVTVPVIVLHCDVVAEKMV